MKFFLKKLLRFLSNVILVTLLAFISFNTAPAWAWKPTTHVSLAEIAMEDAIKDGKVTIPYVSYKKGEIKGEIGSYEVNPNILEALLKNAPQYRAGVLGPDAYPDILTGQQVIHPNESVSEKSDSNAWLEYLWRKANENGSLPVRAFVTGFLTHAAGDMFGHTFVNNFTGAPFTVTPPINAIKHIILEGIVDKRSPDPTFDASISGVEEFIYQSLVFAEKNSELDKNLLRQSDSKTLLSIPRIFSTLRNKLDDDINNFDKRTRELEEKIRSLNDEIEDLKKLADCLRNPLKCEDAIKKIKEAIKSEEAELVLHKANQPIRSYKKEWREDIDNGLKEWSKVSHEVALATFFNPTRKMDIPRVKKVLEDYAINHIIKMIGFPDVTSDLIKEIEKIGKKIEDIINDVIPSDILAPIREIKENIINYLFEKAFGISLDDFNKFLSSHEEDFDKFMPTGFGETINCVDFNKKYLKIHENECLANPNDPTHYNFEIVPAAYNTVLMSKMILMSPKGVKDLLTDLGVDTTIINEFTQPNAMLGFIASLDGDNQGLIDKTQNTPPNERKMIFARDCRIYTQLFMEQPKDIKLSRILTEEEKTKERANLKEIYTSVYNREPTDKEISKTFDDLAQCLPLDDTFPSSILFVNNASDKSIKVGSRDFPFKTLTDAINAAKDGDTLLISPGVYPEKITINKKIRLTSYINQPVIIDNTK